jgi:hypothetical protein
MSLMANDLVLPSWIFFPAWKKHMHQSTMPESMKSVPSHERSDNGGDTCLGVDGIVGLPICSIRVHGWWARLGGRWFHQMCLSSCSVPIVEVLSPTIWWSGEDLLTSCLAATICACGRVGMRLEMATPKHGKVVRGWQIQHDLSTMSTRGGGSAWSLAQKPWRLWCFHIFWRRFRSLFPSLYQRASWQHWWQGMPSVNSARVFPANLLG